MHKVFTMPFSEVYPLYVRKIENKGRNVKELHEVITWLTGFNVAAIKSHLKNKTNFKDFFKAAKLNPKAKLITGTICGVRIEEIEDPLMKKIRFLDKLVDELAKGRPMEKVLRK